MKEQFLFGDAYKECPICKRSLPLDYPEEFCPMCMDQALFNQVRDYIRANDVNEHEVAEHFQIPLVKIRAWIREGRIEYKEEENVISGQFCKRCGRTIFSGYFCPMCEKYLNRGSIHMVNKPQAVDAHRMHYLDEEPGPGGKHPMTSAKNVPKNPDPKAAGQAPAKPAPKAAGQAPAKPVSSGRSGLKKASDATRAPRGTHAPRSYK